MGDSDLVSLRAAASRVPGARGGGRVDTLEQRQAPVDDGDDGLSGAMGAAAELARDGASLSGPLGGGLSLGRVVRRLGPGPSGAEGGLRSFREVPVGDLGRSVSRLLDLAGNAQPPGTDEESRPDAARP